MNGFGEIGRNDNFWTKKGKLAIHEAATLCKKVEKSDERILRSKMYVQTEANLKVPTASSGGLIKGQIMEKIGIILNSSSKLKVIEELKIYFFLAH